MPFTKFHTSAKSHTSSKPPKPTHSAPPSSQPSDSKNDSKSVWTKLRATTKRTTNLPNAGDATPDTSRSDPEPAGSSRRSSRIWTQVKCLAKRRPSPEQPAPVYSIPPASFPLSSTPPKSTVVGMKEPNKPLHVPLRPSAPLLRPKLPRKTQTPAAPIPTAKKLDKAAPILRPRLPPKGDCRPVTALTSDEKPAVGSKARCLPSRVPRTARVPNRVSNTPTAVGKRSAEHHAPRYSWIIAAIDRAFPPQIVLIAPEEEESYVNWAAPQMEIRLRELANVDPRQFLGLPEY